MFALCYSAVDQRQQQQARQNTNIQQLVDHMQAAQQRPYILIGSEHSLYTGKLRAYLIWRGLPFVELTASAELYKQVILPRTGEGL